MPQDYRTREDLIHELLHSQAEQARLLVEASIERTNHAKILSLSLDVIVGLTKELAKYGALIQYEQKTSEVKEIRCTQCGSIETEVIERNPVVCALLYFCRDCGHSWFTPDPSNTERE